MYKVIQRRNQLRSSSTCNIRWTSSCAVQPRRWHLLFPPLRSFFFFLFLFLFLNKKIQIIFFYSSAVWLWLPSTHTHTQGLLLSSSSSCSSLFNSQNSVSPEGYTFAHYALARWNQENISQQWEWINRTNATDNVCVRARFHRMDGQEKENEFFPFFSFSLWLQ